MEAVKYVFYMYFILSFERLLNIKALLRALKQIAWDMKHEVLR